VTPAGWDEWARWRVAALARHPAGTGLARHPAHDPREALGARRDALLDPLDALLAAGRAPRGLSPHWLRHAHATHALERGAPIHIVQAALGHASVATTGRYLHARPTDSSARYLAV
jgi:integrase